jgi:hypothetical protein
LEQQGILAEDEDLMRTRMPLRMMIATAGMVAVGVAAPLVIADVVFLNHGGRVEGVLLNPDESPRRSYLVQTREGMKLSLAPSQVERVVVKTESERKYEAFAARLPDTVAAHLDAAEKCSLAGLPEQRAFHLEQVLRLDPDHTATRHALGYSRIDGKWIRQEEAMESKGYVRAGGAWKLPQELAMESAVAEVEQREVQWRKDLRMWRDWLGGRDPQKFATAEQSIRAIRDPLAVPVLIDMLTKDKEPPVLRQLYVDVIGEIGGPLALALYVRLAVEDRDPVIRDRCVDRLAREQSKVAVRQFIKYLKHDENLIVQRAAVALERMKDPEATPALIEALITTHKFLEGSGAMSPTFTGDGGAGLSMGGGPKVVKRKLKNDPVLRALTVLNPGVNLGFNQAGWKDWYRMQYKPPAIVSLRRDE